VNEFDDHSWGPGGIFGKAVQDALEVVDEMNDGPHPDGNGGFREKPGVMNRLGAEDAIARRRDQKARRNSMLLFERFIDELPDMRDKLLDSFGPDGLRGRILDWLIPQQTFMNKPETVREALGARVKEASLDTTAAIFLRAYERDIARAQAAVRLGAFEPEEWAHAQAQKILTAPATLARAAINGVSAAVARMRHVKNAMTESLVEPEVVEAEEEKVLDEQDP
jgi:hypothetical protein